MSELDGLSGVRVASLHQKDAVMLLPSLRQSESVEWGEGRDGCGAPGRRGRVTRGVQLAAGGQGEVGKVAADGAVI